MYCPLVHCPAASQSVNTSSCVHALSERYAPGSRADLLLRRHLTHTHTCTRMETHRLAWYSGGTRDRVDPAALLCLHPPFHCLSLSACTHPHVQLEPHSNRPKRAVALVAPRVGDADAVGGVPGKHAQVGLGGVQAQPLAGHRAVAVLGAVQKGGRGAGRALRARNGAVRDGDEAC